MNARVRHKVGLELGDVDVECSIEAQGCRQRGNDLSQQSIQDGVRGPLQDAAANVIQCFVVHHDGHSGVFNVCKHTRAA